ncbi:protein FAM3C-like [Symphorus nematophorus]
MLTVRVGKMARRQNFRGRVLQCMLVLVPAIIFVMFILQKYSKPFESTVELRRALSEGLGMSIVTSRTISNKSAGPCHSDRECPGDHFSFYIHSGAANVVAPKICLQNKLVLGSVLNNAGTGINIVVVNGKMGKVTKTDHFDMYAGEVKPLIEFLKSIEHGSVVLVASFDEPSSKLDDEAKKLIAELGSSSVQSLGFRDNWVFVGGKGAAVKSKFEKHLKNDKATNKYENWPELIDIQGCIPAYLE